MSIEFDTPGSGDEQSDWMGDSFEGGEPEGGDGNRLFVILAIGLAGLIVLGLFAVGGLLVINRLGAQQQIAQITPTVVKALIEVVPTATFTPTPPPPTPTDTPTIAPTNTLVLQGETPTPGNGDGQTGDTAPGGTEATPRPTHTPIPRATPASGGEVPNTGFGGFEAGLIALGLIAILFVSRRLRRAS